MARARTTLSGLQKHAAYAVVVQAYNSRGAGPASPPTTATTMEDGKIYIVIIFRKLNMNVSITCCLPQMGLCLSTVCRIHTYTYLSWF